MGIKKPKPAEFLCQQHSSKKALRKNLGLEGEEISQVTKGLI